MATKSDLIEEYQETGTLKALPSGHFIDGGFSQPSHNRTMESFDPGRGEAFARFTAGTPEDVDQALQSSRRAFETVWRDTAPAARGRILQKASQLVLEKPRPSGGRRNARQWQADRRSARRRARGCPHLRVLCRRLRQAGGRELSARTRLSRLFHPRTGRRHRAYHPLELPDLHGGARVRPCSGRRLRRRRQAGGTNPLHRPDARRAPVAGRAAGRCVQCRHRNRGRGWRSADAPSGHRSHHLHRLRGHGSSGDEGRRRRHHPRGAGTRRQVAGGGA
jgi:hypothetical protein